MVPRPFNLVPFGEFYGSKWIVLIFNPLRFIQCVHKFFLWKFQLFFKICIPFPAILAWKGYVFPALQKKSNINSSQPPASLYQCWDYFYGNYRKYHMIVKFSQGGHSSLLPDFSLTKSSLNPWLQKAHQSSRCMSHPPSYGDFYSGPYMMTVILWDQYTTPLIRHTDRTGRMKSDMNSLLFQGILVTYSQFIFPHPRNRNLTILVLTSNI